MSMATNRISASGVAAMLYPVMKPSRVAKSIRVQHHGVSDVEPAVQGTSPTVRRVRHAEQVHAAFQYALAALSSVGTTDTSTTHRPVERIRCNPAVSSRPALRCPSRAAGGADVDHPA